MTKASRIRDLLTQFEMLNSSSFSISRMEEFQNNLHLKYPEDTGLQFSLIELIARRENVENLDNQFLILNQAFKIQRAHMYSNLEEYSWNLRYLGHKFIGERILHLAVPFLTESIGASKIWAGRQLGELAREILDLATLHGELENSEKSILLFQEALLLLKDNRAERETQAGAWHILAKTYGSLKRLSEAEKAYLTALELYRGLDDPEANDLADVLNDLGTIYRRLRERDSAAAYFREALDVRRTADIPNPAGIALTLNNLWAVSLDRGRWDEAESFSRDAQQLASQHLAPTDPSSILIARNIAQFEDDPAEALRQMTQVMRAQRARHPPHHSAVISTLHDLAMAYARAGQFDSAVEKANEALDLELNNEQFPVSSKRLMAWGRRAETAFESLLRFMELKAQRSPREDWSEQATSLLTYKGNAEIEQGLASILKAAATGELRDLLERRQELQALVAQTRSASGQLSEGVIGRQLEDLQQLENALEKHPEARRLADELRLRTVHSDSIRFALRPDEVLLNYFVTGAGIFAQILHQDGEHHVNHLDVSGADELVVGIQRRLRNADAGRLYLSDPELFGLLRRAYDGLIAPLESALRLDGRLQSLVISADDYLYRLPWELLTDQQAAGGSTLLEKVGVRLIPTPRDLVRLHRMEELQAETLETALLLGVQQFGGGPTGEEPEECGPDPLFPTRSGLGPRDGSHLRFYANLAGTRIEVEQISATFQDHHVQTVALLSPYATEQRLLDLNPAPSVLHLATHSDIWTVETAQAHYPGSGHTDDVRLDPAHPFSRAVVVLDGYDRTSFRGVLRAWELASLNLMGTQLVTFSSCDSGLGDMSAGRSVAGLSQAAFLAGARRTITTLWPVSDRDAPLWIPDVYRRRLEGATWQDAVRASKLAMIEDEYPLDAWAPFVLNGLA